jgi:hypothetical protein
MEFQQNARGRRLTRFFDLVERPVEIEHHIIAFIQALLLSMCYKLSYRIVVPIRRTNNRTVNSYSRKIKQNTVAMWYQICGGAI